MSFCSHTCDLPYKTYGELRRENTIIEILEFISGIKDHCAPTESI